LVRISPICDARYSAALRGASNGMAKRRRIPAPPLHCTVSCQHRVDGASVDRQRNKQTVGERHAHAMFIAHKSAEPCQPLPPPGHCCYETNAGHSGDANALLEVSSKALPATCERLSYHVDLIATSANSLGRWPLRSRTTTRMLCTAAPAAQKALEGDGRAHPAGHDGVQALIECRTAQIGSNANGSKPSTFRLPLILRQTVF